MSIICFHISDVHMRADGESIHGRDPEARLLAALDASERSAGPPDVVLLGGDQSDDESTVAMRRVRDLLASRGCPLLSVRGNHDARDAHRQVFGTEQIAEIGGWRLVGLDSAVAGQIHGTLDPHAVKALLDGLDARPTIITVHHPPRPVTPHPWMGLEGARELLDLLSERPHVRAVLSGHVHQPFEFTHGELLLLGSPSTLAPFDFSGGDPHYGGNAPTGARVLRLGLDGSLSHSLAQT